MRSSSDPSATASPTPRRPRVLSLEQKLPLQICGLLLLVLGAAGAAAYDEVRHSAEDAARERVQSISRRLAEQSGGSVARGLAQLRAVAELAE